MYDDLDLNNALVVVIINNQVEKFWVLHNQFGTILNLNIVNLEVRYAIFGNSNERTFLSILNEGFGRKIYFVHFFREIKVGTLYSLPP